jgi:GH15 family glucan-1,4-alpha-glucosidase
VRIGNAAVNQSQHDVYGSIIMAATPMFFDRRLPWPGDASLFHTIEPLGEQAAKLALKPDAGIWEYRGERACTRIRPRCAGQAVSALQQSRTTSICPTRQPLGGIAERIGEEVLKRAGTPSARRFRPHLTATI